MSYSKKRGFASDFTVIDFETTGLYPNVHEIIEIGAIKYRKNIEEQTFTALIKPKRSIPPEASQIHGITNADVKDMPSIEDVLPHFLTFIDTDVLIAHNASFDLSFLMAAIDKCNQKNSTQLPFILRNKVADTLQLARYYASGLKSYKLQNLIVVFNLGSHTAHRAIGDCRATGLLYLKLKDLAEIQKK